ncbi:MAG: hypothetical protein ACOY0T_27175 [Myxococcota bacterium]
MVERITHNASGTIVDHYTHWDWEPLCQAVLAIELPSPVAAVAKNVATLVARPVFSGRTGWRRRELKSDAIEQTTAIHRYLQKMAKLTISKNTRQVRLTPPTPPRTNIAATNRTKTTSSPSSTSRSLSKPSAPTSRPFSLAA